METLHISDLVRTITPIPSILATRFTGKRVWEVIHSHLESYNTESVVFLSFDGVDVMDASFADEVFARLAIMRARKEYPYYCYLILTDMNETCEENLQMALITRIEREPDDRPHLRNCVLMMRGAKIDLIGKYENHVKETFSLLNSERELTARDISNILDISLNAASTRLKTIADLGLARRIEMRDEQGKLYIYHALV
jgi:hypothetical protein